MVQPNSILVFDVPPRSIHLVGHSPAVFTAEEIAAAKEAGRAEALAVASRDYDAKLNQLRSEFSNIQTKTFEAVASKFEQAMAQMRVLLPQLVVEATARVVGGLKVDATVLQGIVGDLLSEVAPGTEQLEVQLSEVDLKKMEEFQPQFRQKFPAIEFRANSDLRSGDCMVKTRFGVLDGRIATKLRGLESLLS